MLGWMGRIIANSRFGCCKCKDVLLFPQKLSKRLCTSLGLWLVITVSTTHAIIIFSNFVLLKTIKKKYIMIIMNVFL